MEAIIEKANKILPFGLKAQKLPQTMEAIIEQANRILPFGLKAQNLVPFFIAIKLVSFVGFAIFMMNL